jgi:uncharacterized protein YdhG (YjbR/CyaY superfamily)
MAARKSARTGSQSSAKSTKPTSKASSGFTPEERAAMQERARELKAAERRGADKASDESAVLEKIAAMADADRAMAQRVHDIVQANAPALSPKLWYGMPAYARDGDVVCFFQAAQKFKVRYGLLGFSDKAKLDDGQMWPTAFALKDLTTADEARIAALVKRAAGC